MSTEDDFPEESEGNPRIERLPMPDDRPMNAGIVFYLGMDETLKLLRLLQELERGIDTLDPDSRQPFEPHLDEIKEFTALIGSEMFGMPPQPPRRDKDGE